MKFTLLLLVTIVSLNAGDYKWRVTYSEAEQKGTTHYINYERKDYKVVDKYKTYVKTDLSKDREIQRKREKVMKDS